MLQSLANLCSPLDPFQQLPFLNWGVQKLTVLQVQPHQGWAGNDLQALLFLMHPRMLLAFLATKAGSWLLAVCQDSQVFCCRGRKLHLPLLKFLSAQLSSHSGSCWMDEQPSGVSATPLSVVSLTNLVVSDYTTILEEREWDLFSGVGFPSCCFVFF